jgi:hypothetical protein
MLDRIVLKIKVSKRTKIPEKEQEQPLDISKNTQKNIRERCYYCNKTGYLEAEYREKETKSEISSSIQS